MEIPIETEISNKMIELLESRLTEKSLKELLVLIRKLVQLDTKYYDDSMVLSFLANTLLINDDIEQYEYYQIDDKINDLKTEKISYEINEKALMLIISLVFKTPAELSEGELIDCIDEITRSVVK